MAKVTVIIPSRTERFLDQTIKDVLQHATGDIEVIAVLDGYDAPRIEDQRVRYITLPPSHDMKKRQGINQAVEIATGKYVMSLDAHCMVGPGFDEILARDCADNWVVVPRRYKLDAEKWDINNDQPPIDYEYWMWRYISAGRGSHGFPELHDYRWDARHFERQHIMIDDKLTMQASCWFMEKAYFQRMGFMKVEGYTGWGQEAEEICLSTWTTGGRVVVNKHTWYAHLHKGKKWGRMYFMSKRQRDESIHFAYDFWVNQNREKFVKVIEKFMPIPGWPEDWQQRLWKP